MPTVCVVRLCSTRVAWLRATDRDGPDDIGRSQGYVCSDHFLTGDYDMNIEVRRSLGLDMKWARLVEPRCRELAQMARPVLPSASPSDGDWSRTRRRGVSAQGRKLKSRLRSIKRR
ncbi:hypothetical protein HPB47_013266 [Ixodes persulcatus]|uniref:Uncharacterized protein n=1 Tax=Ixodes persulcatus TaxID=34615 RepID=A0AC60QYX2_IXOPE|nr:hypothetical protein HPB47_013266 [Ixodes persulcatus]